MWISVINIRFIKFQKILRLSFHEFTPLIVIGPFI